MDLSSYPPPLRVDALGSPLLPRLMLEATMSRTGMFDGAWWPRSRRLQAELPDLITALTAHTGSVLRVGLDTVAWDEVPRTVTVDGRVIRISWFPGCDWTVSLTCGFQDHFLLLVVPPATDADTASAAMARASMRGNRRSSAQLLAPAYAAGRPVSLQD
ncbi:DUF5994 family protein [Streptacidiphilus anmyonensis]|uniref:DUF5994 family protein n=1 Tax=Streptacidiphilus anmyonensis TaxID=405782 RepID=UPI00128E213E|nr:DUF5994 family protein [Streptacidiphilus anmyonensis]